MKRAIKHSCAETSWIGRLLLRLGVEGALHSRRLRGLFIGIRCCLPSLLVSTSKQTRLTFTKSRFLKHSQKWMCLGQRVEKDRESG